MEILWISKCAHIEMHLPFDSWQTFWTFRDTPSTQDEYHGCVYVCEGSYSQTQRLGVARKEAWLQRG